MILQINYDLNKAGQNYTGLIEKIKTVGTSWAKPCESCWLVATTKSPNAVFELLKPYIDSNDRMMVSRFYSNDYTGWLSKEIIDWIARHRSTLRELTQ